MQLGLQPLNTPDALKGFSVVLFIIRELPQTASQRRRNKRKETTTTAAAGRHTASRASPRGSAREARREPSRQLRRRRTGVPPESSVTSPLREARSLIVIACELWRNVCFWSKAREIRGSLIDCMLAPFRWKQGAHAALRWVSKLAAGGQTETSRWRKETSPIVSDEEQTSDNHSRPRRLPNPWRHRMITKARKISGSQFSSRDVARHRRNLVRASVRVAE